MEDDQWRFSRCAGTRLWCSCKGFDDRIVQYSRFSPFTPKSAQLAAKLSKALTASCAPRKQCALRSNNAFAALHLPSSEAMEKKKNRRQGYRGAPRIESAGPVAQISHAE